MSQAMDHDSAAFAPPARPAVLGPVSAWAGRCPYCHQSMGGAPAAAEFCRRCGRRVLHHVQRGAGNEFQAWLPRSLSKYQIRPAVTVRRVDILTSAADSRSGAAVALQLLQIEGDASGSWRSRFEREIAAVSTVEHGMEGQLLWVAIEPVNGWLLPDWMRRQPQPLSLAAIRPVARQVAAALQRLREQGIPHREPRPDHVLIAANGEARFTAFGLIESLPSIAAMVPGDSAESASGDSFGLGMIWYELLMSRPPSPGVDPASALRADCPEQWSRLIGACLSAAPSARPTPADIEGELRREPVLNRPKPAAPPPLPPPATPPNRIAPVKAAPSGGKGGWFWVLVIAGAWYWWHHSQKPSPPPLPPKPYDFGIKRIDPTKPDGILNDPKQQWIKDNLLNNTKTTTNTDAQAKEAWSQATAAFERKDWDAAARTYERYTQLKPEDSYGFSALAGALIGRDRHIGLLDDQRTAQQMIDKALALNGRNATALGNRGVLRDRQNRVTEAFADYNAALQIDDSLAWVRQNSANLQQRLAGYWTQADTAFRANNWNEAIRLYNTYIQMNPVADAYASLGSAYYNRCNQTNNAADVTNAEAMCVKALNIDPNNVTALGVRGALRERDGRFYEARTMYERALQIDPKAQWVRDRLDALLPRMR